MLLKLAKHYNAIVRQSDNQSHDVHNLPIVQFKNYQSEGALERVLEVYQRKLDSHEILTIDEISDLARDIVNSQHFVDGNHRTALLMCYHLNLFCRDELLRIKPYLLYASIDFEYLKQQYALEDSNYFFSNNAIKAAILSRSIATIHSFALKEWHMTMIISLVEKIPSLLERIAQNIVKSHDSTCTQQDRLFRTYAGYRLHNEHSSLISVQSYQLGIFKQNLQDKPFFPDKLIAAKRF